ncbi:SDR family oxidoreductase [Acuticoccus kandeliae]|uniref:SDR family oxidoreductase n=1 Tax=Acuticoccus kandeliae TaxID=2073160 RepID=UPI000D3E5E63|nr:SDR family oxidoreductase [Acuticoccus kandeliae]
MSFSDYRTALVTGASAGMGTALVERLCAEGLTVHALARRADRLDELAARTGCIPHAVDITDTEALKAAVEGLEIDVLINNAGVGRAGNITTMDEFGVDELIDLNLRAVLHITRLLLPGMLERDRGHIVNIGSMAGQYNFGGNTVYHATKAAIRMLSQQLRIDVNGKRVRITEFSPGRVETEIFDRNHGMSKDEARQHWYEGYEIPGPADVADAIAYVINLPSHITIGHMEMMSTFQAPGGLSIVKTAK